MTYLPSASRYEGMTYKRCGKSGLKLPLISLGLWMNFGGVNIYENSRSMLFRAFDLGITHFDLANNYGPPYGSAEETFGSVMERDLRPYRDELVISTKAGYDMWPGPYGNWGSRKYIISSLDQSLKRMKLDYVDIFYHHRPDPETPVEESMMALDQIVRSGKALYAGISNYSAEQTKKAVEIMKELKTPFIIHQAKYNMFNRWIEDGLLDVLDKNGMGCIVFSPLAQGLLTDKYLKGIPEGSRASKSYSSLKDQITDDKVRKLNDLNNMAKERNQTLAQMALAWTMRLPGVTSTLIGASRVEHINDAIALLKNTSFSEEEIKRIDSILYSL
ncbi:MAG: L-glyceraldehyde 3-phosphate reductase [Ignavibacteria bacterium]|jgi:L-glyceraldehyde 3-phosphate reductase|nr:L-glyceraldehyde 3-phosphate reductase [Ignavibacteria bacterium]MCU7521172.1 L-glyceraldehyde 3-phosphate reductase [Ignavibacteria bacterium]